MGLSGCTCVMRHCSKSTPHQFQLPVGRCLTSYSIRNVIGIDSVQLIAWFSPMAVGGCFLAIVSAFLMHILSGTIILIITCFAIMVASLLFLFAPSHPIYWAWIFPAMICATVAIDLLVNVVNVFLTSKLPHNQQGLAGAMAHVLMQFSMALLLGVARIVAVHSSKLEEEQNYKDVFWLQFACGAAALVVFSAFVRIEKAEGCQNPSESMQSLGGLRNSL